MTTTLRKPEEISSTLGIPVATLAQWRWRGIGPAYCRVGRHIRYRQDDIDAWLSANRHGGDAA